MPAYKIPLDPARVKSSDLQDPPWIMVEITTNVPDGAESKEMQLMRRLNAIDSKTDMTAAEKTLSATLPAIVKTLIDTTDTLKAERTK